MGPSNDSLVEKITKIEAQVVRKVIEEIKRIQAREVAEMIRWLKQEAGLSEVYLKMSFQCSRRTNAGEDQEVLVEILDAGSDATDDRFRCVVKAKDGKEIARGKPAGKPFDAIDHEHWPNLDK
jgi:hypothetical protein